MANCFLLAKIQNNNNNNNNNDDDDNVSNEVFHCENNSLYFHNQNNGSSMLLQKVTCFLENRILEPSGSSFMVDKRKTQKI